jgi:hypothetical protein
MNMSSFCKNRVCLTHNIMERVATFCKYKMKKIGSTLLSVLLEMLRSRQFYLATLWVLPYNNGWTI